VENLSFQVNGLEVLRNISFAISPGDFLALIGPNGSGKTTLIRIILGILKPTGGRVIILGEEMNHFSQWRRIGYVPRRPLIWTPIFRRPCGRWWPWAFAKRFPGFNRQDEALIDQL
jgi:zinc transport system ATP-binding protein